MDRNLALESVRVTEAAAIAAARTVGLGDEKLSDRVAVEAMRAAFNKIEFRGRVVIGEGERDEAPMLYIGETVGTGNGPEIDLALDPLEGTTITAQGGANAMAVAALAENGGFLHAPDCYMKKIAVGPQACGRIDLRQSWTWNLKSIAEGMGRRLSEITVVTLDRPRHEELIKEVRQNGCRIRLIRDGDVSAAISTCDPGSGIDVLMGTGGAPEGVISAAALRCMGGDFQGQLVFQKDDEKDRARKMGISDFDRIYKINELARGNVMFSATGVTSGTLLKGVNFFHNGATTESVVMRSTTGTIRYLRATHRFDIKAPIG